MSSSVMDWSKLLSTKRLGKDAGQSDQVSVRSSFVRDYDRIIFNPAFRRLQDKTQIFPLAKNDYVRTRLTHSLEVASVGRSLGMLAAEVIVQHQPECHAIATPHEIGALVSAACLAHDIGNPPFGHAGEAAIQDWFQGKRLAAELTDAEHADLAHFEGNAQGFRTLCYLEQPAQRGGMQLTCAVLGAFTKYPRASVVEQRTDGVSGKKIGFMQSERALFAELADELGLLQKPDCQLAWYRHPLAFLVEAADDICYHVMDVEDGYKTGHLTLEEIEALHRPWLTDAQWQRGQQIAPPGRRVEYFRALTLDTLIRETATAFAENHEGILQGSFDEPLTSKLKEADAFAGFKKLARKKVYSARPVVEIEACGFEVIGGLLEAFAEAILDTAPGKARSRTLLSLMPQLPESLAELRSYERMLLVTDFVSGMTDSYAVELYQRIKGISLP